MRVSSSLRFSLAASIVLAPIWSGCSSDDDPIPPTDTTSFVGAVYAMTNGLGQPLNNGDIADSNAVVAYGREANGMLTLIGSFPTGGLGGDFDGPEGLDPLISANAVELTPDNTRLLACNAGSNTVTSFVVNDDLSLTKMSTIASGGFGPNSITTDGSRVFVTNIDADGVFTGETDQEGNVTSFLIDADGVLTPTFSVQNLENRPSDIRLSSNGDFVVISSLTAGSVDLPNDSIVDENSETNGPDEIVTHAVDADGIISARAGDAISSFRDVRSDAGAGFQGPDEQSGDDPLTTAPGNYRNLPSPIGIEVFASSMPGFDIVVATETREFNAFGGPPTLPNLEAGSVSTFLLDTTTGQVDTIMLGTDIPASGPSDPNQLTLCWIASAPLPGGAGQFAYVSNTINSLISSYAIDADGTVNLVEAIAAAGAGPFAPGEDNTTITPLPGLDLGQTVFGNTEGYIDMDLSDDGQFLYQLTGLAGTIVVYGRNGDNTLTLLQTVDQEVGADEGPLPTQNTQGICAF